MFSFFKPKCTEKEHEEWEVSKNKFIREHGKLYSELMRHESSLISMSALGMDSKVIIMDGSTSIYGSSSPIWRGILRYAIKDIENNIKQLEEKIIELKEKPENKRFLKYIKEQ